MIPASPELRDGGDGSHQAFFSMDHDHDNVYTCSKFPVTTLPNPKRVRIAVAISPSIPPAEFTTNRLSPLLCRNHDDGFNTFYDDINLQNIARTDSILYA
uniref:Uncharacterized protein n=1 Tax=Moniliophthora roreri TaxID=221103 RepID=A0A0W0F742_MONRR